MRAEAERLPTGPIAFASESQACATEVVIFHRNVWCLRGRERAAHTHCRCYPLLYLFFLRCRQEYPTWRCCESHSRDEPGKNIPQSAYPKCSPLPTGDWCTQQQHKFCTPEQLDYTVREWVCCYSLLDLSRCTLDTLAAIPPFPPCLLSPTAHSVPFDDAWTPDDPSIHPVSALCRRSQTGWA